jgi:hypothetical protein
VLRIFLLFAFAVDFFCKPAAGNRFDFLVPFIIWAETAVVAVGENGLLADVFAMFGSGQGQWQTWLVDDDQ